MDTTDLLRRALAKAGSQRNLGAAVSASESLVSLWVSGQRTVSPRAYRALLKYLGTPLAEVDRLCGERLEGGA